jgi:uncharacterized integral membrane protein
MRALPRLVAFLIAALLAFWFTVENANETVRIDLVLFRIDAALPIVIFTSVLLGMGATLLVGWCAEGRRRRALRNASFEARDPLRSAPRSPADWASPSEEATPD